jgi:hypothetical protein
MASLLYSTHMYTIYTFIFIKMVVGGSISSSQLDQRRRGRHYECGGPVPDLGILGGHHHDYCGLWGHQCCEWLWERVQHIRNGKLSWNVGLELYVWIFGIVCLCLWLKFGIRYDSHRLLIRIVLYTYNIIRYPI